MFVVVSAMASCREHRILSSSESGFIRDELCRLIARLQQALIDVDASAALARIDAGCPSATGTHAEVPLPADTEFIASINAAQAAKTRALEEEALHADAILERIDLLRNEISNNLAGSSVDPLQAALADAIDVLSGPVEPSVIRLATSPGGTRTVIAPRGVSASHVCLAASSRCVAPGRALQLRFSLNESYRDPSCHPEELSIATEHLSRLLQIKAYILVKGAAQEDGRTLPQDPLPVNISTESGVVVASIVVPPDSCHEADLIVHSVSVTGRPVSAEIPCCFRIVRGMCAPLIIDSAAAVSVYSASTAISCAGALYVPNTQNYVSVLVFGADGTPLTPILLDRVGLCAGMRSVTCSGCGALDERLFLSDKNMLVSLDPESHSVVWATANDSFNNSMGISVLSQHHIVATSYSNSMLYVHCIADGVRVASIDVERPSHIAADPTSGQVFVAALDGVQGFFWDGADLHRGDLLPWASPHNASGTSFRLLAVMPCGPEARNSVLLTISWTSSTLYVVSLPDLRLMHIHELDSMCVVSLAADPFGTCLAVGDSNTRAIHVLPWPLPGCPFDGA